MDLYNELQSSEATNPQLVKHFEDVMAALMTDVKKLDQENKKMEEKIIRYLAFKTIDSRVISNCRKGTSCKCFLFVQDGLDFAISKYLPLL